MLLQRLIRAIHDDDFDALEGGRDRVGEVLDAIIPVYWSLSTWPERISFVHLVQDQVHPELVPIMRHVLDAPGGGDDWDNVEIAKIAALGHIDEKYERFEYYLADREALREAIEEVTGRPAPRPPRVDRPPPATLLEAAMNGQQAEALAMLAAGADVHATRMGGQTALSWAAFHGMPRLAEALLAAGADVDAADQHGGTPLINARDAATTQVLLAHGANLRLAYRDGRTAAWFAAYHGKTETVLALLDAGLGLDEDVGGATLLALAAEHNHLDLVADLLRRGANRELGGPLLHAVRRGRRAVVRALLAAGCEPARVDAKELQALLVDP